MHEFHVKAVLRFDERCVVAGDILLATGASGGVEAGRVAFTTDSVNACIKCCTGFFHEKEYASRCADGCGVSVHKV